MVITNPDWIPPIEMTFDVEKPIRSEQGIQLAGNPIAIAEGAAGAPRIVGRAAASKVEVLQVHPFSSLSAGDLTLEPEFFAEYSFSSTSTNSSTYVSAGTCEISALANGTLRFNASQSSTNSRSSTIRLLKNGSEVQSWTFSTSSSFAIPTFRSVDVAASNGDEFEWQIRAPGTGSLVSISQISVSANDTLVEAPLWIKESQL